MCLTAAAGEPGSVPIVYVTDLYHPHDDPDDHVDLATLFAIPEFDIRAIVIDLGEHGKGRAGTPAIEQMMHLTGRTAPYATGLVANLETPVDTGEEHPADTQGGVELLLDALTGAYSPVTLFTTGSLRDVAAAYNRAPALFEGKVARLYVNAGHSSGGKEHNVNLDPLAYQRILTSGLPIYWAPCFGEQGFETLWSFKQGEVFQDAAPPLQNFFLYALSKTNPAEVGPIEALTKPVDKRAKATFWPLERRMWCTGPFLDAAGYQNGPFAFRDVDIRVDDDGTTTIVREGEGARVKAYWREATVGYRLYLQSVLRRLLKNMAIKVKVEESG